MICLTFRGPCIVIYSYNKANEMHYFSNLFDKVLYMRGGGGGVVIKALRNKPAGRGFDSR